MIRNRTELRLREKKSKYNFAESEGFIHYSESNFKLNSNGDFLYPARHLKSNNTRVPPEVVAETIKSELLNRKFI